MGEAKLRADEIEAMKAKGAEQARQQQMLAFMTQKEAVFVNGFFLSSVGPLARITFLESATQGAPSQPRFATVMHPQDLAQLVQGASRLLDEMAKEAVAAANAGNQPADTAAAPDQASTGEEDNIDSSQDALGDEAADEGGEYAPDAAASAEEPAEG
jgi:hypothetical protein